MNNTAYKRLSLILIAAAAVNLIASALFILTLPEIVPTHFGPGFVCDGTGSRWNGLAPSVLALIIFPVGLFCTGKSKNLDKNMKSLTITLIFVEAFIVLLNWFLLFVMKTGAKLGDKVPLGLDWMIPAFVGVLFIVIGNFLPTVRQNNTLGIKLPWTLNNERCWNAVHRFSGKLYVISGLICIAAAIIIKAFGGSPILYTVLTVAIVTLSVVFPTICAYKHRND